LYGAGETRGHDVRRDAAQASDASGEKLQKIQADSARMLIVRARAVARSLSTGA
jgi:hypothetical protein